MTNQKHDGPLTPVRATMRTTDRVREIGNQGMTYWQCLVWIGRTIANFFPERARRWLESSDAESKALTVTEQIYVQLKSECLDHGYGFYQQPLRHRANDPLDQLLRPVEQEVKGAKFRKPDKPGKTGGD